MIAARQLVEVREADASPEVAALYADIKAASGIPQVNLIYRHLATQPAVLAWAWRALGPAFSDGSVAGAASALIDAVPGDGGSPIWLGLSPHDARSVEAVVGFYNRANPQNLIALTALTALASDLLGPPVVGGPSQPTGTRGPNAPVISPSAPIPPLPRRDALDAVSREILDGLAARQGGGGVTPSLYLHLATWPSVLVLAAQRVDPLVGTAAFATRVEAVVNDAQTRADQIVPKLDLAASRPADDMLQPMLETVRRFVRATIPQMIVVGRILAGAAAER